IHVVQGRVRSLSTEYIDERAVEVRTHRRFACLNRAAEYGLLVQERVAHPDPLPSLTGKHKNNLARSIRCDSLRELCPLLAVQKAAKRFYQLFMGGAHDPKTVRMVGSMNT